MMRVDRPTITPLLSPPPPPGDGPALPLIVLADLLSGKWDAAEARKRHGVVLASLACVARVGAGHEQGTGAAKGLFVERLGDSRQISECRREQRRVVIA
jgi:hypothetical protein